jgi:DNA-binding NtrC family response regulator
LRERADDIPLLVNHFLRTLPGNRGQDGTQRVMRVARDAMSALAAYPWPGNVRELVNVVERAISFCDGETVSLGDLPEAIRDAKQATPAPTRTTQPPPVPSGAPSGGARATRSSVDQTAPRPPEDLLDGATFKDAKEKWVSSFERDYILSLLRRHDGNISHAARDADIDRKYFRKLMKKYGIAAADAADDDDE